MNGDKLVGKLIEKLTPPGQAVARHREVTDEEVTALLAAARVAPSADNLQTWRFIVVRGAEPRARLAGVVSAAFGESVAAASTLIVVCGVRAIVKSIRREQPFVLIDVPISLSHILLQASELDLPCAWTLELDEAACRSALSIPDEVRVLALLALG